jgi:D-alanyl-D-alanine carboxypeptidase
MRHNGAIAGRRLPGFVTICFSLVLLVWLSLSADVRAAGYSAIVLDADTGRVLHAHEADTLRYPASLTKMMTLYMAFDALKDGRLKLDQRITVSARAAGQAPSAIGLRPGQTITVREAILAAVTKSANDATVALGEAIGGTEAKFAEMMTHRARQLGMHNTTFKNASGLPNPHQKSTARDMATLALALLKNHKNYYSYFSTPEFEWNDRVFANHNHLLKRYEGVDGIKTGYIRASGFNLVASAKRNNRRVIGVVFGGTSVKARDDRMIQLLDAAFKKLEDDSNAPLMVEKDDRKPGFGLISSAEAAPVTGKAKTKTPKPTNDNTAGEWAVQLGAFRKATAAESVLAKLRHSLPGAEPLVEPVESGNSTLYRARLTGLSAEEARKACRQLKQKKMNCSVISPDA